jgi:hypothetical protein
MQPASYDIALMRGDDVRVVFQFNDPEGDPLSLVGSTIALTVAWSGGKLTLTDTDGLAVDFASGRVEWDVTAAQSASLPTGRVSRYALARIDEDNGHRTYLVGQITGTGGPSAGDVGVNLTVTDGPITIVAAVAAGGVQGRPGADGADGAPGRDGVDGRDGDPGPPGTTVAVGVSYDGAAVGAANVKAALDALLARLPTLGDVVLSNLRFVPADAEGTVLATITGWSQGAILSVYPNDGRFKIVGNQQEGLKLAKGPSASALGDAAVAIRQTDPSATNGPFHDTPVVLKGVPPMPQLPLANGTKVEALGHSFINYGVVQAYLASQAATLGHQGLTTTNRGVTRWLEAVDGRFNLDVLPDLANPWFPPSSFNAATGSYQGKSGDTLEPFDGIAGLIGFTVRAPYCIARGPGIVYIDGPINDVSRSRSYAQITAACDGLINQLTDAGIWVVLQTMSWTSTLGAAGDPRYTVLDQVNAWIIAQAGRRGVKVCDTTAIDGPHSGIDANAAAMFWDGSLHPSYQLARLRSNVLLPILQAMVTAGERRNLNPLAANLFPLAGTPGTTGTKSAGVVGNVATGMRVDTSTASTIVASKEVVAVGDEKQVLTITPVANATVQHTCTYRMITGPTLASLGMVAGDWAEIDVVVELDDWAGWDIPVTQQQGPAYMDNGLYATGTKLFQANNGVSGRNGTFILTSKLWWPPGLAVDNIRWQSAMLTLRWLSAAAGVGVVKIRSPILRKIADPRAAWNLP